MSGPSISVRTVGSLNPLWWVRVQHRVMIFRATVDPADALSSHAVDGGVFRGETLLAKSLPPGDLSPVATIDRPGHTILDRMSDTHAKTAPPLDVFLVCLAVGHGVLVNRHPFLVWQPVQQHMMSDLASCVPANPAPDTPSGLMFSRQADGATPEMSDVLLPTEDASAQEIRTLIQLMPGPIAELAFGRTLETSETSDLNPGSLSDPDLVDGLLKPPPGST